MDETLLPSGDDDSNKGSSDVLSQSQASLQRSASLLDRIRAQREREAMGPSYYSPPTQAMETTTTNHLDTMQNSTQISSDAMGSSPPPARSMMGASSLNFSGLIRGFGRSTSGPDTEVTRGLLLDNHQESPYTMSAYFRMFVTDMYSYYRTLPIPLQAFGIVFMLWIIYHFI